MAVCRSTTFCLIYQANWNQNQQQLTSRWRLKSHPIRKLQLKLSERNIEILFVEGQQCARQTAFRRQRLFRSEALNGLSYLARQQYCLYLFITLTQFHTNYLAAAGSQRGW